MRIAVASGKGGTGKTLVSTNLSWTLAEAGRRVVYVDTDVEEPNGHLFLRPQQVEHQRFATPVPALRGEACSGCGRCEQVCTYHAIKALERGVEVSPQLCHGCGACQLACEEQALTEQPSELGTISRGSAGKLQVWSALLDIGSPRAAPLIAGLLEAVGQQRGGRDQVEVLDVPPGTSCAAVAATRGADQVVLVTEPTPFGLHDLELAVEMCHALKLPIAVVVNRSDLGDGAVASFLEQQQIPLLGQIPFSREVAAAYARQHLAAKEVAEFRDRVEAIARGIDELQR